MKTFVWSVVVVVVLALAGTAHAQSCPQSGPNLVYPGNGAGSIPREPNSSVTLKWQAVAGAIGYDVYFGPQGTGCNTVRATVPQSDNPNPNWSPPADEIVDGATYAWKVVAKGPTGCPTAPSSVCATFTMIACPTSGPTLISPANNSAVAPGSTTLSWNAVANSSFYEIFMSVDGQQPSLVATTTATSRTITTEPGRTITWAVRASKIGCNGFISQAFQFTTTCPTTPPALLTPANAATFNDTSQILMTWSSVDGASHYGVYKSQDGGQTWTPVAENLTGRSFTTTFGIGNWMWKVRANFAGSCQPLESAPRGFTVISSSCTNSPPVLVSPADGSSHTLPLTLAWTSPAAQGKTFQIFVSGPDGPKQVGTTAGSSLVLTDLAPATYAWWVVEKLPNCPDLQSARRTFTINRRECGNDTITIVSPSNGASVGSPVPISWIGFSTATAYRIWASQDGGAAVLVARTNTTNALVNLPAGSFKFKIEGLRDDCPSVLSAEGNFVVPTSGNCNDITPPQLLEPFLKDIPNTTTKSVVLPWVAQTRAGLVLYRIFITIEGLPFEDVGATRETQIERILKPGKYRWFVQVLYENCAPVNSQTGEFTIEETVPRCPSDKPVIAEPANGATVTTLRFRIAEVTTQGRQVRHRFFAIIDRANSQPETVFLGASNTFEFEPALQLPPGTYQAFVERSVDNCPSTFSDRITFTIARGQNCSNTPPQLQSPSNGAQNLLPEIDFIWVPQGSPAVGVKYVLFVQANDGSPTPVAVTTETSVHRRVPYGKIRWWVVAFPPGCDPTISQRFVFTTQLPEACARVNPPVALLPQAVEEISDRGTPFVWSRVATAMRYNIWIGQEGEEPVKVATTTELRTFVNLPAGFYQWFIEAETEACGPIHSAIGQLSVVAEAPCGTPGQPRAHVIGRTLSGSEYVLRWNALSNVKTYEVQESLTTDFANPKTFLVNDTQMSAMQTVATGAVQYHYRVRGLSDCNDERGPYSEFVTVVVVAPRTNDASVEIGEDDDVVQQFFIPGGAAPATFSITFDKPWVKANPSSGPLPPEGTTVMLTSERDQLRIGGNTATVKVSVDTPTSGGSVQTHVTSVTTTPFNVSLVTPVTPSGKSGPPPDALIFSGVGHAAGQNNSFFESDVRVANLSAQTQKYQINYTPSGTDGTVTGNTTTVEIPPNQTLALDDVVSTLFGLGELSGALGMLEVRPLTTATTSSGGLFSTITSTVRELLTLGSSRTYNSTPNGTFGQFVPATPFAKFVGSGKVLSLLHVAQSPEYRANFGFLEASGNAVDLVARVYDVAGNLLATIPVSLLASEHKQIGLMLATNGITDLNDGRVEVEVVGGSGKITAYVSEVDNATNDPFLVSAVEKGTVSANRYVVPGMAHKDLGFAFWVSDLRIHNAGTTQVPATLTFYAEANPSSFLSKQVMIDPGEIEVLNDVVQNLFTQPNGAGGSVVITTPSNVPLGVTARTYNKTTAGTYGQYLPGVTVAESVGAADRALHILQVEQSSRMRTNIAVTETTGNAATVEVSLILPDSIATPVVSYSLAGNEFRQFSIGDFGLTDAIYNARVTVKVVGGTGKVTAHGSLIDAITNDPALIPPQ